MLQLSAQVLSSFGAQGFSPRLFFFPHARGGAEGPFSLGPQTGPFDSASAGPRGAEPVSRHLWRSSGTRCRRPRGGPKAPPSRRSVEGLPLEVHILRKRKDDEDRASTKGLPNLRTAVREAERGGDLARGQVTARCKWQLHALRFRLTLTRYEPSAKCECECEMN